jgi:transposase
MERRRMDAVQDMLNGLPQSRVAIKFRVSRTTASRWHCALATKGLESLRERKATGRPSRLTPEQKAQIVDVFKQGASAPGSSDHPWTVTLLAKVIEERFGVRYSLDHVGRIMRKLGLRTGSTAMSGV